MHDAHGLDPPLPILGKGVADRCRVGATAPIGVDRHHVQAKTPSHLFPQMRELAGAADQHAIARCDTKPRVCLGRAPHASCERLVGDDFGAEDERRASAESRQRFGAQQAFVEEAIG